MHQLTNDPAFKRHASKCEALNTKGLSCQQGENMNTEGKKQHRRRRNKRKEEQQ
jgi:hypothetical protein